MILGLCGFKGGTGKTTLAIGLVDSVRLYGRSALLMDADPKRHAVGWAAMSAIAPPTIAVTRCSDLRAIALGHSLTVLDTPSGDPTALREFAEQIDCALIPACPSNFNLWSAADTVELLRETRPNLRIKVVLNCVEARTMIGGALARDAGLQGLPLLRTQLGRRSIHAEALASGGAAPSYSPGSAAALELEALWLELSIADSDSPTAVAPS